LEFLERRTRIGLRGGGKRRFVLEALNKTPQPKPRVVGKNTTRFTKGGFHRVESVEKRGRGLPFQCQVGVPGTSKSPNFQKTPSTILIQKKKKTPGAGVRGSQNTFWKRKRLKGGRKGTT